MKYSKSFVWLMLILPWLSAPLLGKGTLKRFLPSAILISFIVHYESKVAKKRRWWYWYENISSKLDGGYALTWGAFLVGSLWILKFTYGKFWYYLGLNLIVNNTFSYVLTEFLKKYGIASLVRLKKYQLSLLFFMKTLILYGLQFLKEKIAD
ncbi:hypothetical protein LCL95_14565 [Bacillus timonensis]|nr:hypothetical protein [Bacillus timonensis]